MTDNEYWFWLCSLNGLGPVTLFPLLMYFGSSSEERRRITVHHTEEEVSQDAPVIRGSICEVGIRRLFEASEAEIMDSGLLTENKCRRLTGSRDTDRIRSSYGKMTAADIRLVPYSSDSYPLSIKQLCDPPLGLFVRGTLPRQDEWLIAVVGARSCTEYGRSTARMICRSIAFSGISVVSGMARGIDSAAHRGCIEGGGRTYAVLGCGADICYPADNIELYESILSSGGGIISEYSPGTEALSWHFPLRNRLIAALSRGIAVIEARKHSGSLITAGRGIELGRDIFAVPGRAGDTLSEGCNDLIRAGAKLVTSPGDILDEFGIIAREYKKSGMSVDSTEKKVYSRLCLTPMTADEISIFTGLGVDMVSSALARMEIKGYIACAGKNQYIIKV